MSMSMPHYENNNNQHDDYRNSNIEQPFDLSMVIDDIPYYDLPAGLMCLLVKVKFNWQYLFLLSYFLLG